MVAEEQDGQALEERTVEVVVQDITHTPSARADPHRGATVPLLDVFEERPAVLLLNLVTALRLVLANGVVVCDPPV